MTFPSLGDEVEFLVGGTGRITIAWKHQTGRSLSQNSSPLVHGPPWYPVVDCPVPLRIAAGTAPLVPDAVTYGAAVAASEVNEK